MAFADRIPCDRINRRARWTTFVSSPARSTLGQSPIKDRLIRTINLKVSSGQRIAYTWIVKWVTTQEPYRRAPRGRGRPYWKNLKPRGWRLARRGSLGGRRRAVEEAGFDGNLAR